jgi:hypothetical protein
MNDSVDVEQLSLTLEKYSRDDQQLKTNIQQLVNDLIVHDFNQLVNFLYRMDVNENKLKKLLHDNPATDASVIITDLLIERQLEKIKTKMTFKSKDDIDDNEKW